MDGVRCGRRVRIRSVGCDGPSHESGRQRGGSSACARRTPPRRAERTVRSPASAGGEACSTSSSPTSSTAARAAGRPGGATPTRARRRRAGRRHEFFSDATRELLQRAAQTALEWGSLDLDTDHLLWAAHSGRGRRARRCEQVGADPDAIAAQIEEEAEKGERTDVAPVARRRTRRRALLGRLRGVARARRLVRRARARAARAGAGRGVRGRASCSQRFGAHRTRSSAARSSAASSATRRAGDRRARPRRSTSTAAT